MKIKLCEQKIEEMALIGLLKRGYEVVVYIQMTKVTFRIFTLGTLECTERNLNFALK